MKIELLTSEVARIITSLKTQINVYETQIKRCEQSGGLEKIIESYVSDIEEINLLINKILN
jgi:hypothetical protein